MEYHETMIDLWEQRRRGEITQAEWKERVYGVWHRHVRGTDPRPESFAVQSILAGNYQLAAVQAAHEWGQHEDRIEREKKIRQPRRKPTFTEWLRSLFQ